MRSQILQQSKNCILRNCSREMINNNQEITILQEIVSKPEYSCQSIRINQSQNKSIMKTIALSSKLSNSQLQNMLQEIRVLVTLNIPCFFKYRQGFIDQSKQYLSVIFDQNLDQYVSLQERINRIMNRSYKPFDEAEILEIGKRLFLILQKLHKNSIIHGNINAKSILINSNNNIKLSQVNPIKYKSQDMRCCYYQNNRYSAPQIKKNNLFSQAGDIWSVAHILFELITLQPYFDGQNIQIVACSSFFDKKALLIPNSYPQHFKDALKKCLSYQRNERPKVQQILESQSFEQTITKINSSYKISIKMSSLKKIGRIGTTNNTNTYQKKKAVHFEQAAHRTSIMNGKSLVELLDDEKKDFDSDEQQTYNKSRFSKANDHSFISDEEQQAEHKIKISEQKKRSSNKLVEVNQVNQVDKMKELLQKKVLNNQKTIKEKKFMSNSFMNYLNTFQKQKLQLFQKDDSLFENKCKQSKQLKQQKKNLFLNQSFTSSLCQNKKIFKQQLKSPLQFTKEKNKFSSSAQSSAAGWRKQNIKPQMPAKRCTKPLSLAI